MIVPHLRTGEPCDLGTALWPGGPPPGRFVPKLEHCCAALRCVVAHYGECAGLLFPRRGPSCWHALVSKDGKKKRPRTGTRFCFAPRTFSVSTRSDSPTLEK